MPSKCTYRKDNTLNYIFILYIVCTIQDMEGYNEFYTGKNYIAMYVAIVNS